MVDYTTYTRLGHEVYKELGGTYEGDTAVEVTRVLAGFWERNKDELKTIGEREAKRIIEQNMEL